MNRSHQHNRKICYVSHGYISSQDMLHITWLHIVARYVTYHMVTHRRKICYISHGYVSSQDMLHITWLHIVARYVTYHMVIILPYSFFKQGPLLVNTFFSMHHPMVGCKDNSNIVPQFSSI